MQTFDLPNIKCKKTILALGAESAGNFSVFRNGKIYFSKNFNDLLDKENFKEYKKELNKFIRENKVKPEIILTDLHPDFKTTLLGKKLAEKHKANHIQIQHHIAHILSQLEKNITISKQIQNYFYGIALDGTGFGTDGKIWGGECFAIFNLQFLRQRRTSLGLAISKQFSNSNDKILKQKMQILRIGYLENQTMIGGELAIREPARMLIAILARIKNEELRIKNVKEFIYSFVKKYYSKNEFELLYNQLQQNFNCIETSSCGRILDAVSILLGFAKNQRTHKHEAVFLLESNSSVPYTDLKPKIIIKKQEIENKKQKIFNNQYSIINDDVKYILDTTHLFKYLIKNINKDKKRLAATAQLYIARGLEEIIRNYELRIKNQEKNSPIKPQIILSGGISNNKIISHYFENKKAGIPIIETLVIPRGDAGISFGQAIYYLSDLDA